MTKDIKTREKQAVPSAPVAEDLSEAIKQAVEKKPDEEVRIVRVFGDRYRCNWWVQDPAPETMLALSTGKIRRSRFLRATKTGDTLVIEDLSGH